jgi:hypothetical protein
MRGVGVPESQAHALGWLYLAGKAGHKGALEKLSQLVVQLPGPPRPRAEDEEEADAAPPSREPAETAAPAEAAGASKPPPGAGPAPTAEAGRQRKGLLGTIAGLFDDDEAVAADDAATSEAVEPRPAAPPAASPTEAVIEAGRAAFLAGDYGSAHAAWQVPAGNGDREAQYLMGGLHAERRYAGYDLAESYRWHYLAALKGHAAAAAALARLEAEISAADRVRGLQLVKQQQAPQPR